jgi:histidine triad (HIT) family protein
MSTHQENCIFCKIIQGDIPCRQVYADHEILAFQDIAPCAPVHFLIIPKQHFPSLAAADWAGQEPLLGRMLALAPVLAQREGAKNGFRVTINTGPDGGQEVDHLHLHVMGGPRPWVKG